LAKKKKDVRLFNSLSPSEDDRTKLTPGGNTTNTNVTQNAMHGEVAPLLPRNLLLVDCHRTSLSRWIFFASLASKRIDTDPIPQRCWSVAFAFRGNGRRQKEPEEEGKEERKRSRMVLLLCVIEQEPMLKPMTATTSSSCVRKHPRLQPW